MNPRVKMAVLGGTFDPFGEHHASIVRWLVDEGGQDVVLVVPSVAHAFKKGTTPFVHRYNMAALAVGNLRRPLEFRKAVRTSLIELELLRKQPGPIRTYELLRALREVQWWDFWPGDVGPAPAITFALGEDLRSELERWANVEKIREEFGFLFAPNLGVHSTDIRRMVAEGNEGWKRHVCPEVAHYIEMHRLYLPTEAHDD